MRTDKRDPLLSDMALHSFEGDGIVAALLSGALRADVTRWSSESRRLAALTLCWLCACADRRIRDRAAKALTRLMSIDPALAPPVCEQITSCDDDYVLESVVQAVYSACLLNPDAPRKFASALHFLFDTRRFSGNAFIREHVLLLGLTINAENLSDEARQRLEIIPNRVAWPDPWPTAADIRAIADLDKLPLNMQLVGDKIQPDFLRYIVAPAVSDFDLKSVNVTQENIATWIMREALAELKYPGAGGNCRIYDSRLSAKYGQGRAKPGYAEGIGKKYYWIALHRLVALLRDNVRPSEYARDSPGLGLRSVDLTDIRDISAPVPYPDEVSHVGRYPYASQAPADKDWFLETIDITAPSSTIVRLARNGTEWVSLDLYATDDDTDEDEPSWTTPHRFVRYSLSSRLAPKDTVIPEQQMRRSFEESGNSTRQLFVGEYPGSPAFELEMAGRDATSSTDELVFSSMTLTRGGAWQYEFASDSRLESFEVPCPDMVDALELKWDRQVGWRDNQGNIVAFYSKVRSNQGLFIQRDALDRYLEMSQRKLLFCIYLNKGKSSPSSGGKQVDRHTFLAYRPGHELTILVEELEPIGWSIRE
jgi:hypothetical protein